MLFAQMELSIFFLLITVLICLFSRKLIFTCFKKVKNLFNAKLVLRYYYGPLKNLIDRLELISSQKAFIPLLIRGLRIKIFNMSTCIDKIRTVYTAHI